ncbi:MAG: aspartate--ammonia ligase [Mogibacterium sp.]|nr:aspartate--ammonia ligase [Mogibacterium sp.]
MSKLILPKNYCSVLDLAQTQKAIMRIKDHFQRELADGLNLFRATAPLFVLPETGLNDNLNGYERRVEFTIKDMNERNVEVVQSLAKWKRQALGRYGIEPGYGLYTDMNAIRRDEELDNIHSIYVDQWDWEKVITADQRNDKFLEHTVRIIYRCLQDLAEYVNDHYPDLDIDMPERIKFIDSQELEDRYPDKTSKERERLAAEEYGAIFLKRIGGCLKSGKPHDGRAPDYDDWELNGDIILWNPVLDDALEISSMGIRVDAEAMKRQLELSGKMDRWDLPFHQGVINNTLPLSIGGGIGQSRLCMFFLRKAHIGEVQASVWPDEMYKECAEHGIVLL